MTIMPADKNLSVFSTDYQRTDCQIGIVHIGYGAFHRAHQAVYIDDYMHQTGDLRWGIAAINLRASESRHFINLAKVEDGYILKTTTPDNVKMLRRVRPHKLFVDWTMAPEDAYALVSRDSVHVISMTVTESGYYLNNDFSLNLDDPIIAKELKNGEKVSIYAFLVLALKKRWQTNGLPINLLCCDNIRANGKMLEQNFKTYLEYSGEHDLLTWVGDNVSFPCSMVDRITPRVSEELRLELSAITGSSNDEPIHAEAFIQWVLENKFKALMPDLAQAEVEIVDDVDPYEEAKIRILNGGHTGLCYLGALKGKKTFDEAILDPELRQIFDNYERNEVLAGLDIRLSFDKVAYLEKITARFSNSAIADQLERICMDGYSKMPIYIRPTLEACLRQGIKPGYGYLCVASWYVYARRFAIGKMTIPYHEPYWDELVPLLGKGCEEDFARSIQLWADLPHQYPDFVDGILDAIREVEKRWPA